MRRILMSMAGVFAVLVLIMGVLISGAAQAGGPINTTWLGTAIDGYDPVAYHLIGAPVEGDGDITYEWNGATWRFANTEHRDLFAADPEKYAPAYGGYCAYGVSQGVKVDFDPEAWRLVDGTLYLNISKSVQKRWEQDIPGYIDLADRNWPDLRDE